MAYEKALASHLVPLGFEHGVWWEYEDSNGLGWCQTDLIGNLNRGIVILECKLSWKSEAEDQLEFYREIICFACKIPVIGVIVCKNLTARMKGRAIESSLEKALIRVSDKPVVWHHLGGVPQVRAFKAGPQLTSLREHVS